MDIDILLDLKTVVVVESREWKRVEGIESKEEIQ